MADVEESSEQIFSTPDLSDLDPSTQGGYRLLFAREWCVCGPHEPRAGGPHTPAPSGRPRSPLEMRLQTSDEAPQEIGTLEAILCKVLVAGDPSAPSSVKVELSSESDLFFHYTHVAEERTWKAMRDEQRLMVEYPEYPNVLAQSFTSAIKVRRARALPPCALRAPPALPSPPLCTSCAHSCTYPVPPPPPLPQEPHTFLAVFIMNREGQGRLDFIQNVSFKFVELLSIPFARSSDDVIRQQIAFRYNAVKSKLGVMQSRLQDIVGLVKLKNPSLLLAIQKQPAGGAAGGGAPGAGGSTARGGGLGATAGSASFGQSRY